MNFAIAILLGSGALGADAQGNSTDYPPGWNGEASIDILCPSSKFSQIQDLDCWSLQKNGFGVSGCLGVPNDN